MRRSYIVFKILLALLAAGYLAIDDNLALSQHIPPGSLNDDDDDREYCVSAIDDDLGFGRDGFPGRRVGGGSRLRFARFELS
jgi:hypothetical protein